MIEMIETAGTLGFPVAVTAYLLYERSKFNAKMIEVMEHISTTLEAIDRRLP